MNAEWDRDPLAVLRAAARRAAAASAPALVSMTPEVERKLGAVPPPLFEVERQPEFPIMERMVHEVIKRENDEYREALRKLRAEEAPAHPREEECMGHLLAAADRYADVYRITLDEALNLFATFLRMAK